MIGAMFWAMNTIIDAAPSCRETSTSIGGCVGTNGAGSSMTPRMTAIFLMISEMPCRPSSDKADQQERLGRPDDQAAGIVRHLAIAEGQADIGRTK